MSDASQVFQCVVPANTTVNTRVGFHMNLGLSEVTRIILTWPAGCAGLVAVRLEAAGTTAFPVIDGQYWAYDDFVYDFEVSNQIQTGQWTLAAYNGDVFNHTVQLVMEYDYVTTDVLANAPLQVSV